MLVVIQGYFVARGLMRPDSTGDFVPGQALIMAFLYGVALYIYRDVIPYSLTLFGIAVAAAIALLITQKGAYLAPLPLTYITTYMGLLNPQKGSFIKSGDYSYGLYLYGFPLQQLVAHFGPSFHHWWINFGLAMAMGLCIAYFSWNFVELPASRLRPYLLSLEQRYILGRNRLLRMFRRQQAGLE
ncbi:hypothetical protein SAMN05192549_10931 [Duganella sacchari]|uniref:Acyltransferase family protein n=1 Tax=Duganella sacchari TaxID=551987 RepID=A0A1M7R0F6_9BURK|nr:hypothetical protein [Duganella sacchari]SHN38019.1 hypothetical protein SAMN05192549_10931 [Duganella sacchari]